MLRDRPAPLWAFAAALAIGAVAGWQTHASLHSPTTAQECYSAGVTTGAFHQAVMDDRAGGRQAIAPPRFYLPPPAGCLPESGGGG